MMRIRRRAIQSGLALLIVGVTATACGGPTRTVADPTPSAEPAPSAEAADAAPEVAPAPRPTLVTPPGLDTVTAGPFDNGKMWTFEYPPLEYFAEAYGFAPDSAWFARARLGALRIPNCSASFVSRHGLVMTNHHCARESITQVSRPGESLLDNGFYARSLAEERPVEDFYAEQLIAIVDVSEDILSALEGVTGDAERAAARDAAIEETGNRVAAQYGGEDSGILVETIGLWDGARYSAYVFLRYEDVRLVMAPHGKVAFFGGDPDNFTYPRYDVDMSFFRVYSEQGQPVQTDHFFSWNAEGVREGDAVFVIGNPGSTNRLQTVAQLEYRRDVQEKAVIDFTDSRATALQAYYDAYPDIGEELDLRNDIFSLQNSRKAYEGMWEGLHDPITMAKRRDSERHFHEALEADSVLTQRYGDLLDRMASIQQRKAEWQAELGAFFSLGNPDYESTLVLRAWSAFLYLIQRQRGAPEESLTDIKESIVALEDQPVELQHALLTERLRDFQAHLGGASATVMSIMGGRPPAEAADSLLSRSALADSARAAAALEAGTLTLSDPALQMVGAFIQRYANFQISMQDLEEQEEAVAMELGRARFDVYGTRFPPDATFSLRIADGVVRGYNYNGTIAPHFTTFYGMYDRFHSFGSGSEWDLPEAWLDPPETFDLATPLNFVLTADIIGGNSGSPVVNSNLEAVGLIFDGNIESLPGDYIYDPSRNRAVAVDVRGMLEALDDIYDADRLVLELTTGRFAATEAEADAARDGR
jgi:hypothetical protein